MQNMQKQNFDPGKSEQTPAQKIKINGDYITDFG
jgi:hypothetical protein